MSLLIRSTWINFVENRLILRAAALTYYTLLSIVPFLAVAFGLAKGFGFESQLKMELFGRAKGQEEAVANVINFAQLALEQARGSLIAGVGLLALFWTIFCFVRKH